MGVFQTESLRRPSLTLHSVQISFSFPPLVPFLLYSSSSASFPSRSSNPLVAYYIWGEGQQNITVIKHDYRARAHTHSLHECLLFYSESLSAIDSCGGITNKTVAPLHVAGRCSQHASFSGRLPSVCGDRWLPQDILKSNNDESGLCRGVVYNEISLRPQL